MLAVLLTTAVLLSGCPRVLSLDYQPSTSIKGGGPIRVDAFAYAGHPTGLMKEKELQSSSRDPEALYLSQNIGDCFAGALKKELALAGYDIRSDSTRTASGTIEQFFLDYVDQHASGSSSRRRSTLRARTPPHSPRPVVRSGSKSTIG